MLEIGAAITVATHSFSLLKSAFAAGRDIEQMSGDLDRWMSAASDIERREKENKKPPYMKRLFAKQSVQREAIELFAAKKRLEKQRYELKLFIMSTHGMSAWDELVRLEGKIRKQRQQAIYQQREARQRLIEWVVASVALSAVVAFLCYLWWLYRATAQ